MTCLQLLNVLILTNRLCSLLEILAKLSKYNFHFVTTDYKTYFCKSSTALKCCGKGMEAGATVVN